jgi:hypothetical protein
MVGVGGGQIEITTDSGQKYVKLRMLPAPARPNNEGRDTVERTEQEV